MKLKSVLKRTVISFGIIFAVLYLFWCFGVPKILNSDYMVKKYETIVEEKLGFQIDVDGFNFKTRPDLSFTVNVREVSSIKDEIEVLDFVYHSKILSVKPSSINAKKINLDLSGAKHLFKKDDNKKSKFDMNKIEIPLINIHRMFVKIDDKNSVFLKNVVSKKEKSKIISKFKAKIITPYFKDPVYVGRSGFVSYKNKIYFENLSVENKTLKLFLNDMPDNIHISGNGLSAPELESTFLYAYKVRHPEKRNFIENFSDFKGTIDVDLIVNKNGFYGKCVGNDLGAAFSKFKIPVFIPKTDFYFKDREMRAKTNGTFGSEPTYTDVVIHNIATPQLHTVGNVKSVLTKNFTQKYFPQVMITKTADASVKYDVTDGEVNIDYNLVVNKGSNITSKYGNLDLSDKKRKLFAHTQKNGDKIQITEYNYSIAENGNYTQLLGGDGLFDKIDGHYKPVKMTLKTNNLIPLEYIKSFTGELFDNGTVNADLQYDFIQKRLTGFLRLYDVQHNDFLYLSKVEADVTKDDINIKTDGKFFGSPLKMKFVADSKIKNGLLIKNIDIYLSKFYLKRTHYASVKKDINYRKEKFAALRPRKPERKYNIKIQSGKIKVGEIVHSKFNLNNVVLYGKMDNQTVEFFLPETNYAKGMLSAAGSYDVSDHSSNIHFMASEIDSNEVVTRVFNLPDHFEGKAFAPLHLNTKDKLRDIKAYSTFAISDGYMPKLGTREFTFNKPNKFKKSLFFIKKQFNFTLSKISNIDFSRRDLFYSNLRGNFSIDNEKVENLNLFSESANFSMFIEGDYNINTQYGNLVVWGKHNKKVDKKIKIFKIPLSMIYRVVFKKEKSMDLYTDKVEQIPPINAADPSEIKIFRVEASGNLNSDNIKMNFRDIRDGKNKTSGATP